MQALMAVVIAVRLPETLIAQATTATAGITLLIPEIPEIRLI